MVKTRIIIVIVSVGSIWGLYSLPKVVVDNDEGSLNAPEAIVEPNQDHDFQISPQDQTKLTQYRNAFLSADDNQKSTIFADSLARFFIQLNRWDSAAYYLEVIVNQDTSETNYYRAGNAYYNAFGIASDRIDYLDKATLFFEKVLELNPNNLDAKNKLAMTFVAGENPMQGITLLRQILETDPENKEALFSLGMLSMQSAQWEKAVERFQKLIDINDHDLRARFYLALSQIETGDHVSAKEHLLYVKKHDEDPEVQANVDSYLKELE